MAFETLKTVRCFGGEQHYLRHDSSECGGAMELTVYVPPLDEGARAPVVYFLSGLTCTAENFTTKAGAQRIAAELGVIVVAPDTSPRGAAVAGEDDDWDFGTGAGFYVDATEAPWAARYRMYSYVTQELPALVDAAFPTAGPERRAIFGHSMGGHGALVIGLREPERWRSVSALSPICAPSECPWGQKAFAGYLGADRTAWGRHDATVLVSNGKRHPRSILIDQGRADPFLERELHPDRFEAACNAAGQPLELRFHEGYDHSYFFIASFVEDHLRHHAAALAD